MGHGYDVHRFGAGEAIMLGGVRIPHHRGLEAHSDGDVLIHAICDALLGAFGPHKGGDLLDDIATAYGLYSAQGHISELTPPRYPKFLDALGRNPALLNLAGVRYLLVDKGATYPGAVPAYVGRHARSLGHEGSVQVGQLPTRRLHQPHHPAQQDAAVDTGVGRVRIRKMPADIALADGL